MLPVLKISSFPSFSDSQIHLALVKTSKRLCTPVCKLEQGEWDGSKGTSRVQLPEREARPREVLTCPRTQGSFVAARRCSFPLFSRAPSPVNTKAFFPSLDITVSMSEPSVAVKCVPLSKGLAVCLYLVPSKCLLRVLVSQGVLGTEDLVMNKIQFSQSSSVYRIDETLSWETQQTVDVLSGDNTGCQPCLTSN